MKPLEKKLQCKALYKCSLLFISIQFSNFSNHHISSIKKNLSYIGKHYRAKSLTKIGKNCVWYIIFDWDIFITLSCQSSLRIMGLSTLRSRKRLQLFLCARYLKLKYLFIHFSEKWFDKCISNSLNECTLQYVWRLSIYFCGFKLNSPLTNVIIYLVDKNKNSNQMNLGTLHKVNR